MRIAHADVVHVVERVADVVDARAAHADALRNQARASLQVELAHIGGMIRIGDERQGFDVTTRSEPHRDQTGFVDAARHFPIPQARKRAAQPPGVDAVGDAPAGPAAAQPHDEPGLLLRAAIARGKNAQRAVIAVRAAERALRVVEAGRPHQRAVAEDPEVPLGQLRAEFPELHGWARL
jgi:hypothetical protein